MFKNMKMGPKIISALAVMIIISLAIGVWHHEHQENRQC